ncbi:hypothetical protein TNCV_2984201 [Trichonephila clavipes]|nr:hypothetical protein TNCV_2984201 [Trichonephila clavipes]
MPPSQYGGYDPRLVTEWVRVRISVYGAKVSTVQKNDNTVHPPYYFTVWSATFPSHVTRRTLNSPIGFVILPWPAHFPDLNLIEHPCDLIGRDMNRGPLAQTVDDLCTSMNVAWQRLPQATINRLIDRMLHRVEASITARGGTLDTE